MLIEKSGERPPVSSNGAHRYSDAEQAAVRDQMQRMLAHSLFRNSKRYPPLFRFVVEAVLQREPNALKERHLGVRVFGREPDYDTNLDPIVRYTAGEIRKRIAQYYHLPEHQDELRIEMPSGSYRPGVIETPYQNDRALLQIGQIQVALIAEAILPALCLDQAGKARQGNGVAVSDDTGSAGRRVVGFLQTAASTLRQAEAGDQHRGREAYRDGVVGAENRGPESIQSAPALPGSHPQRHNSEYCQANHCGGNPFRRKEGT